MSDELVQNSGDAAHPLPCAKQAHAPTSHSPRLMGSCNRLLLKRYTNIELSM
uniref:AT-rich interactive domain-containing protein 3 n=1 Tax=Rhizophora mucronata TaxID=61149 RepID=A0A2P2K4Y1_RHIMU